MTLTTIPEVELAGGPVEFEDTGGDGPVVVLLHGLLMDSSLWTDVVSDLAVDHRCILPTLPLGAHRRPMHDDADLSLTGIAALTTAFLDRLGLHDVVLVGNDTGGAIVQLVAAADPSRLRGIVLVSCEAFDNVPPGLTGRTVVRAGRLPAPIFGLFMQQLRLRPVRRLPISFGWLTKRGDATTKRWLRPVMGRRQIRRDATRVLRAIGADRDVLVRASEGLASFHRPVRVVWATEDRVMPLEHAHRLVELFDDASLVEIDDSYTLVPLDQPTRLATAIREFTATL
jgi:pimeloyl-ACP methyl ester carboxylesterase